MGWFKQRYYGPVAVCLELSKGPLVYALQKYNYLKPFPVNPTYSTPMARFLLAKSTRVTSGGQASSTPHLSVQVP